MATRIKIIPLLRPLSGLKENLNFFLVLERFAALYRLRLEQAFPLIAINILDDTDSNHVTEMTFGNTSKND